MVDMSAQVPSDPLERCGRKPRDSGHTWLSRDLRPSKSELLVAYWRVASGPCLGDRKICSDILTAETTLRFWAPHLATALNWVLEAKWSDSRGFRGRCSLDRRVPADPETRGPPQPGSGPPEMRAARAGPGRGPRGVLTCSSWGRGFHRRIPCPRWRRSSRR